MTRYLDSTPFSTYLGGDKKYADNWEATFGKKPCNDDHPHEVGGCRDCPYEVVPLVPHQTIQEQVREFHTIFKQPIVDKPAVPGSDRLRLRVALIGEEFCELLEGCGVPESLCADVRQAIEYAATAVHYRETCIVEIADALADLAYVVEGMALECGIDSEAVLAEVHRSNKSKIGPNGEVLYNQVGKVVKPETYSPPDIAKVLRVD